MWKISYFTVVLLSLLLLGGCRVLSPNDNFNPELEQRIDKIEGSQNTLENNQNAIRTEIGRLQNAMDVAGNDNEIQQGWLNVKADGVIIGGFCLTTIAMLLFYMHKSHKYEKIASILGEQIRANNDYGLKERVMASAWKTEVEKDVFDLIR